MNTTLENMKKRAERKVDEALRGVESRKQIRGRLRDLRNQYPDLFAKSEPEIFDKEGTSELLVLVHLERADLGFIPKRVLLP